MYNYAYLSTSEIELFYIRIKGSRKGISSFLNDAYKVASRTINNKRIYKDEHKLYEVFEKHLAKELNARGIDCFGRLMQYVA